MYNFKVVQEMAWAVGIAVAVYVVGELVFFDAEGVADWKKFGIALFSGAVRAAAAAVLTVLRPKGGGFEVS